jgi:hypothetical protein
MSKKFCCNPNVYEFFILNYLSEIEPPRPCAQRLKHAGARVAISIAELEPYILSGARAAKKYAAHFYLFFWTVTTLGCCGQSNKTSFDDFY